MSQVLMRYFLFCFGFQSLVPLSISNLFPWMTQHHYLAFPSKTKGIKCWRINTTKLELAIISRNRQESLSRKPLPATRWVGDDGFSIAIWSTCDWVECAIKIGDFCWFIPQQPVSLKTSVGAARDGWVPRENTLQSDEVRCEFCVWTAAADKQREVVTRSWKVARCNPSWNLCVTKANQGSSLLLCTVKGALEHSSQPPSCSSGPAQWVTWTGGFRGTAWVWGNA